MQEELFSSHELIAILKEASQNQSRYLDTIVLDGKATAISIHTITPIKQLIFPEGNAHTGFQHLRERHSHFAYKNFWIKHEENGQLRLDRPSKFHPDMAPAIDYSKIADAVFRPEHKNITKNHRPDVFDKYTGMYAHKNNPAEKYHLLTYKDTAIVHTLFPDKKKHNLKAVAKFGKGHVKSVRKLTSDYADLIIPYEDAGGVMRYSILLRRIFPAQIEQVLIQEHGDDGEVLSFMLLGERKIEGFESFDHAMMSHFQHRDLIDYERIINQLAAGEQTIVLDASSFRW